MTALQRAIQYVGPQQTILAEKLSDSSCRRGAAVTNRNRVRRAPLLAACGLVDLVSPEDVAARRVRFHDWSYRDEVAKAATWRRTVCIYLRGLRSLGVPYRVVADHVRYWRRVHHRDLVYLADTLHTLAWQAGGFHAAKSLSDIGSGLGSWVEHMPDLPHCNLYPDGRSKEPAGVQAEDRQVKHGN